VIVFLPSATDFCQPVLEGRPTDRLQAGFSSIFRIDGDLPGRNQEPGSDNEHERRNNGFFHMALMNSSRLSDRFGK
jgi:hypothetical protein